MSRLTKTPKNGQALFDTGYDDCVTCGGAGVIFLYEDATDLVTSCPECDKRDLDFEALYPTERKEAI